MIEPTKPFVGMTMDPDKYLSLFRSPTECVAHLQREVRRLRRLVREKNRQDGQV